MKIKKWLLAAGCAVLLCGCTKSNIVRSEDAAQPDFNMYMNVELDINQLHEDVNDIYLDESDYPMAAAIDFDLRLDESAVDVIAVVKDGTSAEDAAYFADVAIKGINDQVAVQDFSYGESDDDTFGGLYQDNVINLKIYEESAYNSNGAPMFETQVPMDEYQTFEINP